MTTIEKIRAEIAKIRDSWGKDCYCDEADALSLALQIIDKYAEQEPCDDVVSRQAVVKLVRGCNSALVEPRIFNSHNSGVVFEQYINELPSVRPQEQTGHWIEKDGFDGDVYYDCSECGESWTTIEGTPWQNGMNYCPNCGCRMVEPQESEKKGSGWTNT